MINKQPRPEWATLPRPGCVNVEFRVLLSKDGLAIANLRFGKNATIDAHDAAWEIDVICLSGSGYALVGKDEWPISAGQTVRWPKDTIHCLRTTECEMETLMVERHGK